MLDTEVSYVLHTEFYKQIMVFLIVSYILLGFDSLRV